MEFVSIRSSVSRSEPKTAHIAPKRFIYFVYIIFILLTTISCSSAKRSSINQQKTLENQISCSLELNKDRFQIGDELRLYFVIENLTKQPIFISNSPYNSYYIDGIRSEDGYDIKIKTEKGEELEQTISIDFKSGRYGITKIGPQEQMKIRIHDISKFELTANSGLYKLDFDNRLFVYIDKKKDEKYDENNSSDFKTRFLMYKTDRINVLVIE